MEGKAVKFWKFEAPGAEQIDAVVVAVGLPPSVTVPGLQNTYVEVARKLKPGDGVVLATLKGEEGKILAFGKVRAASSALDPVSIQWAKASHGVLPTGSGLKHWQTKTAFEISPEPAERYGLRRFVDFHIKDAA
jgi:hypothetical protein